jgi:hypothetical protein
MLQIEIFSRTFKEISTKLFKTHVNMHNYIYLVKAQWVCNKIGKHRIKTLKMTTTAWLSANYIIQVFLCKIWGFHGDVYEENRLLGSAATCSLYSRRDSPALKMEAIRSSEMSVPTTTTRHQIPEDDFLQVFFSFSFLRWGETESTWHVGHCLAYYTCPEW